MNYLFVDMGCLREVQKRISHRYFQDEVSLEISLTGLRGNHHKVFVYDAVPAQNHGEEHADWDRRLNERMIEVKRIRSLDGFHMPLGDLRGRKASQKKVDVMITVDMLMHTVRGNMQTCTLLTGDSDFQPLLEALTREGMVTTLWCPPHAPEDLRSAADSTRVLDIPELWPALARPGGAPLAANSCTQARALREGESLAIVKQDGRFFELTRGAEWLIERYDPQASAMSEQIRDADARIAIMYAEDVWRVTIPEIVKRAANL